MRDRKLKALIQSHVKMFPAIALLGPRQAGKTTLAKTLSPIYYDLELEEEKLRLDLQWEEIIQSNEPVILDGEKEVDTRGLIIDFGPSHNDQSNSPARASPIKVDKCVVDLTIGSIVHVHGRHDDPVCEGYGSYGDRFEELSDQ